MYANLFVYLRAFVRARLFVLKNSPRNKFIMYLDERFG